MKSLAYAIGIGAMLSPGISLGQEGERPEIVAYRKEVGGTVKKMLEPLGLRFVPHRGTTHRSIHIGYPLGDTIPLGDFKNRGQLHIGMSAERWQQSPVIRGVVDNTRSNLHFGFNFSAEANIF